MTSEIEKAKQRIQVISELLDMEGVPCDLVTGNAMINLGIGMLQRLGVPDAFLVILLQQAINNLINGTSVGD